MTKPIDIISRSLKDIGALAPGEPVDASDAQDAFDMMNDLLDQWSNESMMVYYKNEIIFPVVSGQTQYTIGPGGQIGATFQGYVYSNQLTVAQLTSGGISLGQTLSGTNITSNTSIVSFGTGAGGQINEAGTYTLNQTQSQSLIAATSMVSGTSYVIYSVGTTDFTSYGAAANTVGTIFTASATGTGTGQVLPVYTYNAYYQRPLAINSGFVRVNTNSNGIPIQNGGLDYPLSVLDYGQYQMIGLKTLPGPWPKAFYYQPTETLGNIFVWPNPSQGELHLFADVLFTRYSTINDTINLPQGFVNALRWCLAERLMPMFGKVNPTQISMINAFASQAKAELKRTNMRPPPVARYDEVITSSRSRDAGFILSGGFFR